MTASDSDPDPDHAGAPASRSENSERSERSGSESDVSDPSDAFDGSASTARAGDDSDEDPPAADAPGSDESEWRFGLDEVGPEAEDEPEPIEPGSPTLENALFVLVGVAATLLLLSTVL